MSKKVFTVTIDVSEPLPIELDQKVTPEFIESTLDAAMAKKTYTDQDKASVTVHVTGGGPFTEWEQYRIWLRDAAKKQK